MNHYAYNILKFNLYMFKIKIKWNQTLKFDISNKIKVNAITIDKVVYMTHYQEN